MTGVQTCALPIFAAQNNWKVNEIKKEEGRLDDVFRNITLSDTKPQ